MKKLISATILLVYLLSFLPQSALAAEIELYNHGEAVNLSYPIEMYAETPYIELSDLENLGLYCEYDEQLVEISDWQTGELRIYKDSNYIAFNNESMLCRNALRVFNDIEYVSLDLVAMYFSVEYSVEGNIIELYTLTREYWAVSGRISLPEGAIAEEDIEVRVFVGNTRPTASSGASNQTDAGFEGIPKPVYTATSVRFQENISKTLVIPKGLGYVDFILKGDKALFAKSQYIGYKTPYDEIYQGSYAKHFYYNSDEFEIIEFQYHQNTIVQGKVTLPEAATYNVGFTVAAESDGDIYIGKGVVAEGESVGYYEIELPYWKYYNFGIMFDNGEYMRQTLDASVYVSDIDTDSVDFIAQQAQAFEATLTLPDGLDATDKTAVVVLQSAVAPYYYLDEETVNLENPTVTLHNDTDCSTFICYYYLTTALDGTYKHGHYSKAGTTALPDNATILKHTDFPINIQLLEEKLVEVTVKLPDGEIADEDITGNLRTIYRNNNLTGDTKSGVSVPETGTGSSTATTGNVLIPAGAGEGKHTISFADEEGYSYQLMLANSYKSGNRLYYTTENEWNTTYFEDKAAYLNSDSITMTLMPQNIVYGKLNTDLETINPYIRVYALRDDGKTESIVHTIPNEEGTYSLYLPYEVEKYIFTVFTNTTHYYANGSTSPSFEDAEIITITKDFTNIDIHYDGYNPTLPIKIYAPDNVYNTVETKGIKLVNISDYTKSDLVFYAASYDKTGRMTDIYKENIGTLLQGDTCVVYPKGMCEQLENAHQTKFFVWRTKLLPTSAVEIIDRADDETQLTRVEISRMVVEFYEEITGREIEISEAFTYTDTTDKNALKLHQLDIVRGYEDGTFKPDMTVTHSELITILNRTMKSLGFSFETPEGYVSKYNIDITHWVYNILLEMECAGVLNDVYPTEFPDFETATNATAVELIYACKNAIS